MNVQVTIDENGKVVFAKAITGHPLLLEASEKSAYVAEFSPTLVEGRKVRVTCVIVFAK